LGFACVEGSCAAEATGGGDHATITIHNATCPNPGSDIYANCHGNALGGVDFDFNGFEVGSGTETTNASGVATHTILEAAASGDVTISEDPDVLADYSGAYVFCSEQNSGDVLFDGPANGGSVTISAQQGDDIICDWYNLSGEASNGGDGPTTLPNTGSGSDGDDSSGIGLAALAGAAALLAAGKKVRASAAERGVDA
jgi:LPXTG-motif cell wall-anchored protein